MTVTRKRRKKQKKIKKSASVTARSGFTTKNMTNALTISELKKEINTQIQDQETLKTLLVTTFKGLEAETAKRAMLEGMMRGFSFTDFLQKNVYAIPFGKEYSLVTSIDCARKIGMKSGIVGKSAPTFEEKDGKIISCTVTVKKKVGDYIGEFTATVYFNEYNTGRNQWHSKPRTMIAKVAEMHALRMACPEEAAKMYLEEEYDKEHIIEAEVVNIEEHKAKLENCKNMDELKTVWASLPAQAKKELETIKQNLKTKYENPKI